MDTIPPLTALRCFESVARLGAVTLAARELHVTHSAVSQQIRILEETMGVPLFVREARGLRLTEEGRLYALEIRSALRDIAQATRIAQTRPQPSELVIATLPSFALHWLVPRLPSFRERHPYYTVRLQTSLEVQDIRHGLADIGIRIGQGHWPDLDQSPLFTDEMLVVASPSFNGGDLPTTAEAIAASPVIRSPDTPWAEWCRSAGVEVVSGEPGLCAIDSNISIAAVMLGQGITLERLSLVADGLANGTLVELSPVRVPYPHPYWLVWQQRGALSVKQTHFTDWIAREVEQYIGSVARPERAEGTDALGNSSGSGDSGGTESTDDADGEGGEGGADNQDPDNGAPLAP